MNGNDSLTDKKIIALLVDADNSPAQSIQKIFTELATHGRVTIRRAYGNWTSSNLKSWEALLQEHAIQPIQQYDLTKGKNATDIAIAIDAMDILYTKQNDIFCLVTSDCDFTPLATRIISEGKFVIGIGERKTPAAFVNACSTFLFLDEGPDKGAQTSKKRTAKELQSDTELMHLIREAIAGTADDDGWAKLSHLGSHIANHASFDPRNYGYAKLSCLLEGIGLFELKRDGNQHYIVRDFRASTKNKTKSA